ncbi:LysR family transcriptional regulator [Psychromonas sp. SP041]|uniref:LysR family transcriptional regulator n=1 Tax=Psychromonas sp. SP041 TaxID=1365007 RepID=UPI0010C7A48E|nr:LysR family transcriptional regulator [Psychromonas sp. SP041]
MKVSSFKYFLAVAETGSVRQAAKDLHVSPSAISRQIQNLEHNFKSTLFERKALGMTLTEEGRIIEKHMRRTMREMEVAQVEIDEIHGLLTGTINYSTIEGVLDSWMLPAIAEFQTRYTGIKFNGRIYPSDTVYQSLTTDQVDLGIALEHDIPHEVDVIKRFKTGFKIALSPNHKLADRDTLELEELAPFPLAMLCEGFHTRHLLDTLSTRNGLSFNITFELDNIEILKQFVLSTNGATILPDYSLITEAQNHSMKVININEGVFPKSTTVLCVRKGRYLTKATRQFISFIREIDII